MLEDATSAAKAVTPSSTGGNTVLSARRTTRQHPAREGGGDRAHHRGWIVLYFFGDVSGKGMPAALFTARTKSLIRITTELMRKRERAAVSSAEIIGRVNCELCQNNNDMMFVTLFFGMLSMERSSIATPATSAGSRQQRRASSERRCPWHHFSAYDRSNVPDAGSRWPLVKRFNSIAMA